jgi:hypothetical protein
VETPRRALEAVPGKETGFRLCCRLNHSNGKTEQARFIPRGLATPVADYKTTTCPSFPGECRSQGEIHLLRFSSRRSCIDVERERGRNIFRDDEFTWVHEKGWEPSPAIVQATNRRLLKPVIGGRGTEIADGLSLDPPDTLSSFIG